MNEAEESQEDKRSNRRVTQESPNPRSVLFQEGDKGNLRPPSINRSQQDSPQLEMRGSAVRTPNL